MAMVFGMLPLSLGLSEGAEFRRSMGTVLIGGLLSSLILTLFLVPVIYAWVVGFIARRTMGPERVTGPHLDDLPPVAAAPPAVPLPPQAALPAFAIAEDGRPDPLPLVGLLVVTIVSLGAAARMLRRDGSR